tara:strand:- start:284 stop:619 length:336 start_codon:yes stop_codon:yes gene_type:complete
MNKSEIFKILLEQHDNVTIVKAHILHYRYFGDMAKRDKLLNDRSAMQYTICVTAQSLLGDKMYKAFKSECISITETRWYKIRKFNYDGTPLNEGQIKTRDWVIARDAKRAA